MSNREVYDSRNNQGGFLATLNVVFSRRKLIYVLIKYDIYSRYKKSVLGIFWSFLNPLLIASVIYYVFGRIFNGYMPESRGYASWVLSGVLLQLLLLVGITSSSNSLQTNMISMSRNRIQPIIIAISSAVSHATHFVIGAIALIPLAILTSQTISFRIVLIPLYIFLVCLWLSGLGMMLIGWFIRFDDAALIFNALIMVITYLSPFFYPIAILSERVRMFVELNPITSWIVTFRWIVYDTQSVELFNLLIVIFSAFLTFTFGIFWLRNRWNDYVML
jgi:ABC-type polysaccharide/polyol phosphate export permease